MSDFHVVGTRNNQGVGCKRSTPFHVIISPRSFETCQNHPQFFQICTVFDQMRLFFLLFSTRSRLLQPPNYDFGIFFHPLRNYTSPSNCGIPLHTPQQRMCCVVAVQWDSHGVDAVTLPAHFFIGNSIFHLVATEIWKTRLKVTMQLLVVLTDFRVNLKEQAHFWESCLHFLNRGSNVACELLGFSETRKNLKQKLPIKKEDVTQRNELQSNATLQRNTATQRCNATLQRNVATQRCNATLQRNATSCNVSTLIILLI